MVRPVFSPSDFVQMKGRGTRKCTFQYQETGETDEKEKFLLLDFFGEEKPVELSLSSLILSGPDIPQELKANT
jgi:type I site-specific restriction endonuclease